jgi:hypothetical protein
MPANINTPFQMAITFIKTLLYEYTESFTSFDEQVQKVEPQTIR